MIGLGLFLLRTGWRPGLAWPLVIIIIIIMIVIAMRRCSWVHLGLVWLLLGCSWVHVCWGLLIGGLVLLILLGLIVVSPDFALRCHFVCKTVPKQTTKRRGESNTHTRVPSLVWFACCCGWLFVVERAGNKGMSLRSALGNEFRRKQTQTIKLQKKEKRKAS